MTGINRSAEALRHPKAKSSAKSLARRCRGIPPLRTQRARMGQPTPAGGVQGAAVPPRRKTADPSLRSGWQIFGRSVPARPTEATPFPSSLMRLVNRSAEALRHPKAKSCAKSLARRCRGIPLLRTQRARVGQPAPFSKGTRRGAPPICFSRG